METPLCNCGSPASILQQKKEGPNQGKSFYKCPTSTCKFFQWVDSNLQKSSKSNFQKNSKKLQEQLVPKCPKHNIPTIKRIVSGDTPNRGKWYFACPKHSKETPCFWSWEMELNRTSVEMISSDAVSSKDVIKFQLVSEDKVEVSFEKEMYERIKGIKVPGLKVENMNSITLPTSNLIDYRKLLDSSVKNVHYDEIPDVVFRLLKEYPKIDPNDDKSINWSRIPTKLMNALFPFQKMGISFGIQRNGSLLIGDEMGLGKTLQAMAISFYFFEDWPLLIICPASLRINWALELEKWLIPSIYSNQINIITDGRQDVDNKINIISYDLAVRMEEKISTRAFKTVIVDECHYLKNPSTERYKKLSSFIGLAKHTILITGTPALSRPNELFSQLDMIISNKMQWFTKWDYSRRYCDAKETAYGLEDSGSSNLTELNLLLGRTVMIRRLKNEVLKDLPDKIRQEIYVNIKTKDEKDIKGIMNKLSDLKETDDASTNTIEKGFIEQSSNLEWIKAYQATGIAKLPAVKEYLSDVLETGEKFLVFGHHRQVLDEIEEHVKSKKIQTIRIDGDTPGDNRSKLVQKFQTDPDIRVAILSIQAAGVGLTLTAASTVIFAEITWNPGALQQCEDRVHRISQKNCCVIQYLLGKGTLDDMMWKIVNNKTKVLAESLNGTKTIVKHPMDEKSHFDLDQKILDTSIHEGPIPRAKSERDFIDEYDLDDDFIDDSEFLDIPDDSELLGKRLTSKKDIPVLLEKNTIPIPQKTERITSDQISNFVYKGAKLPYNLRMNLDDNSSSKSKKEHSSSEKRKSEVVDVIEPKKKKVEVKKTTSTPVVKKPTIDTKTETTPKAEIRVVEEKKSEPKVSFTEILEKSKHNPSDWKKREKFTMMQPTPQPFGFSPRDSPMIDTNRRTVSKPSTPVQLPDTKRKLDYDARIPRVQVPNIPVVTDHSLQNKIVVATPTTTLTDYDLFNY